MIYGCIEALRGAAVLALGGFLCGGVAGFEIQDDTDDPFAEALGKPPPSADGPIDWTCIVKASLIGACAGGIIGSLYTFSKEFEPDDAPETNQTQLD